MSKIAFCFLTYDNIVRYDIWNKFFENIDNNKFAVFIHPKNLTINTQLYSFPINIVNNPIYTNKKEDISIVKATLKLFTFAYNHLNGNNISHFIFLTQSCIPLFSFNNIYNIISKLNVSLISFIEHNKKERYNSLSGFLKKYISPYQFVKQQPNMVLTKEDAKLFIDNDLTQHFKYMECPDEHYFINIITYFFKKKYLKVQTHFCNINLNRTQGLEFNYIDKKFINNIRELKYLFMRKVNKESIIDINYLLNL
jgi:hypothetical protein